MKGPTRTEENAQQAPSRPSPGAPGRRASGGVAELDGAPAPPQDQAFAIVGIGASAGGLAAFDAFFSAIPADSETGIAFVLVQHLAPDHKSVLSDLCQRFTRMQVREVTDGIAVLPNHIYVIPPNHDMALSDGRLHLREPAVLRGLRLPIDCFFHSLAQDQQERAICVVLSGTGSDGTLGVRAVKAAGGLVLAQAPETAGYDGMPRSVIATGLTDFILPPAQMPAQIMAYVAHAFGRVPNPAAEHPTSAEDTLKQVCNVLRDTTGHDFSQYKQSTLSRRVARRMALHQIERQGDYLRYLQQDPTEVQALFSELLIGVTNFFRDPEAFAVLETQVIPRLFIDKPAGGVVRVWVCGCSTGEEAYSIAILLQEHLDTLRLAFKVQVFATDIDRRAIAQARTGVYPASIAANVSPERLARFFCETEQDGAYRVQKPVRDLLLFSEQDLIKDPPFSRLDLISCRNVLIYMDADLQNKVIPLFHYALNPDGALFLGTSETVGDPQMGFSPLSRKWKIYIRQGQARGAPAQALGAFFPPVRALRAKGPSPAAERRSAAPADLGALTEQALIRHYAPIAVLVNGRGAILHIHGRTGLYLEPSPGDAAMNILAMAREGLRRELTDALRRVVARREAVRSPGLRVRSNGDFVTVDLTVRPAGPDDGKTPPRDLFLVVLEPAAAPAPAVTGDPGPHALGGADAPEPVARIVALEQELQAKDEYLQSALEEMATANEELTSTNEEMQSINEELQSANEELETSKEELQSVNEELATVNVELQTKVADLSQVNNDMNNLLAGTGVATLFLDHRLRITRFTPASTQLIKLIQTDVGRPVGDLVSNLVDYDRLVEDTREVLTTLVPKDLEVQTRAGTWHLLRIRPYRTLANVIEGAVITFIDITQRKQMDVQLRQARAYAEGVVEALREALVVLDQGLCVRSANRAFYRLFRVLPAETEGRPFRELGDGAWNLPELDRLLTRLQCDGTSLDDYAVTGTFPGIGPRTLMLNARCLGAAPDALGAIFIAMQDLTDCPVERPVASRERSRDTPGAPNVSGDTHERTD